MTQDRRYYIRRLPCWGGTFHYVVWDSETRKAASRAMVSERSAKALCGRLNADWIRYLKASASRFYTGPVQA